MKIKSQLIQLRDTDSVNESGQGIVAEFKESFNNLSQQNRRIVIGLYNGLSINELATFNNLHTSSIYRIIHNIKQQLFT